MPCCFYRVVRDVFSMTVTIKQRPEAWEGGSSPHVQVRAVQVGRNEDTKALKLESAFLFGVQLKVLSKSKGKSRRRKRKERILS